MQNYLIINEDNMAFEAFNCENIKDAIKKYASYLFGENNKKYDIFIKSIKNLNIEEIIILFNSIFQIEIFDTDKITKIYKLGEQEYGNN